MKKIFIFVPLVLLFVGIGYIAMKSNAPAAETQTATTVDVQPTAIDNQISPTPLTDQTINTSLSESIGLTEIAKHAVEGNCWTAIDGNVYDLSQYTSKHPGGPVILTICGKDGSALFNGKHGEREKKRIESMIIGSLVK